METKFNFKSQICTDKNQSERLLALGLKKETADMVYTYEREEHGDNYYWNLEVLEGPWDSYIWPSNGTFIPAWSLHRLLMMLDYDVQTDGKYISLPHYGFVKNDNIYDNLCDCIEWLIKEGYFPKEYLV
jgi:hypothetical protein